MATEHILKENIVEVVLKERRKEGREEEEGEKWGYVGLGCWGFDLHVGIAILRLPTGVLSLSLPDFYLCPSPFPSFPCFLHLITLSLLGLAVLFNACLQCYVC